MEAWARSLSDYSSELGRGAITATEAVVLRYIGRSRLTSTEKQLIQLFRQPAINDARARGILDNLGLDDQFVMVEAFGAEDVREVAQFPDSLAPEGVMGLLKGAALLDSLYEEDEDDDF